MNKLLKYTIITLILTVYSLVCYSQTKPLRIVTLSPSLTDTIIELGAADLLVGVLDAATERPAVIAQVPSIGKFNQFSLEKLISVKPDIILTWPTSIKPAEQQQLKALGYKLIESNPLTLDDIANQIAFIGKQIGREKQGQQLATEMHNTLAELRKKYHREKPLKVFYQLWGQPIYTIGKNQFMGDALQTCGAQNIFNDIDAPSPIVNIESILARNPQVIIASQQDLLDAWKKWPTLQAVKQNNLLLFDNKHISIPSFAILKATKQLCTVLASYE